MGKTLIGFSPHPFQKGVQIPLPPEFQLPHRAHSNRSMTHVSKYLQPRTSTVVGLT